MGSADTPPSGSEQLCAHGPGGSVRGSCPVLRVLLPGVERAQCLVPAALRPGSPWRGREASAVPWRGAWRVWWQPPSLGVGGPAGAAAGLAVVPVAAQVHLDGQGAVGARLVLAAVVWVRDTVGGVQGVRIGPPPPPLAPPRLFSLMRACSGDHRAPGGRWPIRALSRFRGNRPLFLCHPSPALACPWGCQGAGTWLGLHTKREGCAHVQGTGLRGAADLGPQNTPWVARRS